MSTNPTFVFSYLPAAQKPTTSDIASPSLYDQTYAFLSSARKAFTNPKLTIEEDRIATLQQVKAGLQEDVAMKKKAGMGVGEVDMQATSTSPLPHSTLAFCHTDSKQASEQLLLELAHAAEEAMVSTRSHHHALEDMDTNSQAQILAPGGKLQKRKRDDGLGMTLGKAARKRRTVEKAVAVVIEEHNPMKGWQGLSEESQDVVGDEKTEMVTAPDAVVGEEEEKSTAKSSERTPKRLPSRPKSNDSILSEQLIEADDGQIKAGAQDTLTTFEDDEPNPPFREESSQFHSKSHDVQVRSDDGFDSDDDIPEEIPTAVGQDKVGVATAKVAELTAREDAVRKIKRREHEQRMRAQVEGAKKRGTRKMLSLNGTEADTNNGNSDNVLKKGKATKMPLPDLLPDELLNAEPTNRILTSPATITQNVANTKKKVLLDTQDKPPKDLIRGNTKIRVLQEDRMLLPPKSSAQGKSIRERWLLGQRGSRPTTWVPRRKPLSSFVRKSM
ncbi:MAG: hypothetical protein Q9217_000671 [Psora testacea]